MRRKKGRISMAFRLSEAARVTAALDRGRGAFKRASSTFRAGSRRLRLPRLGPGRYRVAMVAIDAPATRRCAS